jgi:hypothetical protein
MPIQLILPDLSPSTDAHHAAEPRRGKAPVTLTIEVLTRRERVAVAQHAECAIRVRKPDGQTIRLALASCAGPLTFTA